MLTDIHEPSQAAPAAEVADILQIPAFLCRQTDLLLEAGRTGRVVNIKKGQFVAPHDIRSPPRKSPRPANGKSCSPSAAPRSATTTWWWTCAACRSCAISAGRWFSTRPTACSSPAPPATVSGGQPQFIEPLARAAVAVGIDGLFVEVHDAPERALSDGANALRLDLLGGLWRRLRQIDELVKRLE